MPNPEIAARVIRIVKSHVFEQRPIQLHDTVADLKIDSLALAEILFDLEEEFDLKIEFNANRPEDAEFQFSTVGEAVAGIEALLARQHAGAAS
jgi:acyl carrier protein